MNILHVLPSLSREWGGPVAVVDGLTRALDQNGVHNTVIAATGRRVGNNPIPLGHAESILFRTSPVAHFWTAHALELAPAISRAVDESDVVHIHELWHYPHYAAYRAAVKAGKPYVVRICGELEPWALSQSCWKKRLYMALLQRKILQNASAIHAITDEERDQIRSLGFVAPISVIPHGVDLEQFMSLPDGEEFRCRFPVAQGKLLVLFLGRLHPKKGLRSLAQSFGSIARQRDDVCLVLAGPNERGYQHELESTLSAEGVLERVVFPGMLTGAEKLAAFAAADIYVLPSNSDVRGVATLEALASGLPVVITPHCQFPEVAEACAGLIVDSEAEPLTKALCRLLDNPQERESMGKQGRELIRQRFTWSTVARQVIEMYELVQRREGE